MKISNTANRLKQIMSEKNLKQIDIIEMAKPICQKFGIKLTKADLSQYVSGKVEPGQFKLMALSYALDVNEVWLMGFDVPRGKCEITNVSHQDFDDEALWALSVLASYGGYDFNIFANSYEIKCNDFIVHLSKNEVEDYVNESIHQIQIVTKNIIENKLHDNIVSVRKDYSVSNVAPKAARNNYINEPGEIEKTYEDLSSLKRPE